MNKKLVPIILIFNMFIFMMLCTNILLSKSQTKDTLHLTNEITKSHLALKATNNILYILPPEKSFTIDTNLQFLGLSSAKYPNVTMRFIYSGKGYDDNDSLINLKYKMLKKLPVMNVNNHFRIWAYKVQLKNERVPHYTWLIFVDNDISYIQGTFTYDKKYDNVLGKNMEKVIKSIVSVPNPDVGPERSVFCEGDYSMLGLKFVPQVMAPVAYFTEDAKPFRTTKHSQMFAIASPPDILKSTDNKVDISIAAANQILSLSKLNDSVIVEQLGETEINGNMGYWIKGSLQNNVNKKVTLYYIDDVAGLYFLLFGLCDAKDADVFFEKIDKFKATVKRRVK